MVDSETVLEIRDKYPWTSWAIWDSGFPDGDCVECTPENLTGFFLDRTDQLTPNIVLLGLNRAGNLDEPFQNFHAPTRNHYDYRLKTFIQDEGLDQLQGAYMTDLVDEVNPNESEVTVSRADGEVFVDQLRTLDYPEYHILCFGEKPFRGAINHFGGEPETWPHEINYAQTEVNGRRLHFYRVWFYGAWGANQDKVEVLQRQLQHLNKQFD